MFLSVFTSSTVYLYSDLHSFFHVDSAKGSTWRLRPMRSIAPWRYTILPHINHACYSWSDEASALGAQRGAGCVSSVLRSFAPQTPRNVRSCPDIDTFRVVRGRGPTLEGCSRFALAQAPKHQTLNTYKLFTIKNVNP